MGYSSRTGMTFTITDRDGYQHYEFEAKAPEHLMFACQLYGVARILEEDESGIYCHIASDFSDLVGDKLHRTFGYDWEDVSVESENIAGEIYEDSEIFQDFMKFISLMKSYETPNDEDTDSELPKQES